MRSKEFIDYLNPIKTSLKSFKNVENVLSHTDICVSLVHGLSMYQYELSKIPIKGIKNLAKIKILNKNIKQLLFWIEENNCKLEAIYPGFEPKIERKNGSGKSLLLRSPVTLKDDTKRILYGTNGKINKNKEQSQLMKDLLDDINELKISPVKRSSSIKKSKKKNVLMDDLLDF
jgi:hypothetical protein